jgi:two-component system, chemotaxis family, chemotaxis protein CheY
MRALLVDDSSTMRSVLRMILRKAGFETIEAKNGAEALCTLEQARGADVALVDWNMPQMNGYEFLCAVRKNPAFDKMQVVMVTTETEMSQVESALSHGANEYIMKPFTPDAVLDKLQIIGILPNNL